MCGSIFSGEKKERLTHILHFIVFNIMFSHPQQNIEIILNKIGTNALSFFSFFFFFVRKIEIIKVWKLQNVTESDFYFTFAVITYLLKVMKLYHFKS